jgi:hypothetical protein
MFGHQCKRAVKDSLEDLTRCARAAAAEFPVLLAESRTALRSDDRVAETNYQEGKVQNLQRAAAEINGAFLQAGKTFSFWKEVGRTSKRRGYAVGRTLQEGCLIPAVGVDFASSRTLSMMPRCKADARSSNGMLIRRWSLVQRQPKDETRRLRGIMSIFASARRIPC